MQLKAFSQQWPPLVRSVQVMAFHYGLVWTHAHCQESYVLVIWYCFVRVYVERPIIVCVCVHMVRMWVQLNLCSMDRINFCNETASMLLNSRVLHENQLMVEWSIRATESTCCLIQVSQAKHLRDHLNQSHLGVCSGILYCKRITKELHSISSDLISSSWLIWM